MIELHIAISGMIKRDHRLELIIELFERRTIELLQLTLDLKSDFIQFALLSEVEDRIQ